MKEPTQSPNISLPAEHASDSTDPNTINSEFARNVLREDLRHAHIYMLSANYDLDPETRDRLLAHIRQDAAHMVLNTGSLLGEVKIVKRIMIGVLVAVLAVLILVGTLVLRGQ